MNNTDTRIKDLYAASYFKLSDNLYGRITGGYLESMYSGLSSEILYYPSESNVALGAEVNLAKARDFEQLFGTEELEGLSKVNGHLSGYWDTKYYNYIAQLDVGKYLAGDKGGTLTLSRDFPNGWQVGGFFTLTNVSFAQFGEGSFDKGIFLEIPINPIIPYETTNSIYEKIRPTQGDGGQRLNVPGRLYELNKDKSKNSIDNSWYRLWR